MNTRASLVTAVAVALVLTVSSAPVRAWSNANRLVYLTFSGAVGLPGVTLAPGTYAFDILNPDSSAHVVRVRNRDQSKVYFLGLTDRIERPSGMPADRLITFGEVPRGAVPPIVAWFPSDSSDGRRFRYAQTR